jgi:hypothetical protein
VLRGVFSVLHISVMSFVSKENLTSSLPISMHFNTFYCLIALAKTFSTIWNKSRESEYSFIVPDHRGNAFMFSSFVVIQAVGFLDRVFIALMYCASYLISFPELYNEGIVKFTKCFSCIHWVDHVKNSLHSVVILHLLICICWTIFSPWDKSKVIMVSDLCDESFDLIF